MRKILLGTTAVVSLALAAPAAFAQTAAPAPSLAGAGGPTIRLGGYFDFSYGVVSDSADKAGGTGGRAAGSQSRATTDFRNDAEIFLYVDGRAANGLQYGAVFELQMDNMAATGSGQGVDFDEMYGFVKGAWGELRFGAEDGAAGLMQVRPPTVLGLGTSADWDEFLPAGNQIIASFQDNADATKIIYMSPQFSGFDFGFSYAANRFEGERADTNTSATVFQRDNTGVTNELTAAIRYRGTLGGVGVQASLSGMSAESAKQAAGGAALATRERSIKAYHAGLALNGLMPGLAIGIDYHWGNYRGAPGTTALNEGVDGSTQIVLGATYTVGALAIGAQYGNAVQSNGGTRDDRTQTYIGAGLAYTFAPGMAFFASYNVLSDENVPTAAPTNAGATLTTYGANLDNKRDISVALAGVRLAF